MKFRNAIYIVCLTFILSCHQQPVAKWPMVMPEAESLSDREKIKLLLTNTNSLSTAGLAAIAQLYENQGLYQKALLAIEDAIEMDPMNSSYHSMKADYAFQLGNKSVAYRESITAYQLGSKSLKQSLDLAQMAVSLSEFRLVNNMIDSLLVIYPEDHDVLYLAARKYDKEGRNNLARLNYRKVYERNPDNQENNYYYSLFLVKQANFPSAKSIALENNIGDSKQAYFLKAEIYQGLEIYDSAALWYLQSLKFKNDTVTYNLALKNYQQANLPDSVTKVVMQAAKDYPANKNYLHTAAKILDEKYQYEEALVYYLSLYQLDTLDTLVGQELAYLQRKIAYLQRRKREQKILADSLSKALPILTF